MTATQPRAPQKRTRYIVAIGGCVLAVVAVVILTIVLAGNVMYYRTVSEAVNGRESQGTDRFRLAGAVVPGSIDERAHTVRFKLTDGRKTVSVVHQGVRPELFKKNAPVLCEGRWSATTAGAPFDSDRIMIKHGNEYEAPNVDTKNAPAEESAGPR